MRDMSVFDNLIDENFEEIKKLSTLVINGESIVWAIKRDFKDALAVEKRTSFRKGLFAGAIVATCVPIVCVPIVCVVKERIMSKKEKSTK